MKKRKTKQYDNEQQRLNVEVQLLCDVWQEVCEQGSINQRRMATFMRRFIDHRLQHPKESWSEMKDTRRGTTTRSAPL